MTHITVRHGNVLMCPYNSTNIYSYSRINEKETKELESTDTFKEFKNIEIDFKLPIFT